jgi:hypothetical protein
MVSLDDSNLFYAFFMKINIGTSSDYMNCAIDWEIVAVLQRLLWLHMRRWQWIWISFGLMGLVVCIGYVICGNGRR